MFTLKGLKLLLISTALTCTVFYSYSLYRKAQLKRVVSDYIYTDDKPNLFAEADDLKYDKEYSQSISAFNKLLEANLPDASRVYAYNQLAYLHLKLHQDSSAAYFIKKIEEEFPDLAQQQPDALADYYFNKGILIYNSVDPTEAEFSLKKALEEYKKLYKNPHLRTAECMNTLGMYYYEYGKSSDSALLYIPLANQMFVNTSQLRGYKKENELAMGQLNWIKRNPEAGEIHCDVALSLALKEKNLDSVFISKCYHWKGNFIKKRGQTEADSKQKNKYFKEAENNYKKAITLINPKNHLRIQEYYSDLIINYYWQKDSVSFFNNLSILEDILKKQPQKYGYPERLRGYYFFNTNNIVQAINWYEQLYLKIKNSSHKNRQLTDECSFILSLAYNKIGDYDKAVDYMIKNMLTGTIYESKNITLNDIQNPEVYKLNKSPYVVFEKIATILLTKYHKTKSLNALKESFKFSSSADKLLFPNLISVDDAAINTYQKEVAENLYAQGLEASYLLYQNSKNKHYLDDAFRYCERPKSFLLFRDLNKDVAGVGAPDPIILDSIRAISSDINNLRRKRDDSSLSNEESQRLADLQDNLNAFFKILKEKNPDYYRFKVEQPIPDITEIQKDLKENSGLIQYSFTKDKLYILFTSKRSVAFIQKDSIEKLNDLVSEYNELLKNVELGEHGLKKYCEISHLLYEYLLGDLTPQLNSLKDLLIIADKSLHQIPFEALTTSKYINQNSFSSLPYLIQKVNITYSPAWKIYNASKDFNLPENPQFNAFTYGDITKNNSLIYAQKEIESIKKIFGKYSVKEFIKENCTKDNFIKTQGDADILHLSLHAESNAVNYRDSKIFFKLPQQDPLFGYDIPKQNFKAQLAVLSACQTAKGKTSSGEGVYSLSRSFLQGGIKRVIASLWKVDDWATSELMKGFYQQLKKLKDPSVALHQAKIDYLKSIQNPKFAHPFYWASFECID